MKNKILTISIVLIMLSFIFISNVSFGATYDLNDYKNHTVSDWNWCIVHTFQDDKFYFLTATNSGRNFFTRSATYNGVECSSGYFKLTSRKIFGYYEFNKSTETFENYKEIPLYGDVELGYCEIIATSSDIYNADDTSEVFFPQTPLPSQEVIQPTLMEIVESNLKTQVVQETLGTKLTTLIKVGLTIFGLLLAPFLIKFRN